MRIGVVGCGQMGAGIVEVAARAGCEVIARETDEEALHRGRTRIEASLAKAAERGKLGEQSPEEILGRIAFVTELEPLENCQLVIEAIVEDAEAKFQLFGALDELLADQSAILASNTSSIPIGDIASHTTNPTRVIGLHFFNPVPVMPIVEVIRAQITDEAVALRAETFVRDTLHKEVVHGPDRAGFIVNALLIPYLLSSIRFYEQGLATKEDIDTAMELGCNMPMGPLKLSDFIGLDTVEHIADVIHETLHDHAYEVPPLLREMIKHGQFGKKNGSGFYQYS